MNAEEIAWLLAAAQAYDRRNVGQAEIAAWLQALGDLPFELARRAVVEHYKRSAEWIKPAHIRELVRQARNDAAMRDPERFAVPDDEERGGEPMVIGGVIPRSLRGSTLLREALARAKVDRAELVAAERRAQRERGEAWAVSDRRRRSVGGAL